MVKIKKLLVYGGLGLASAFTLYHFWPKSANHEAEEQAEVATEKPYKEKVDVLEGIMEKKDQPSAPKEKPKDVLEGIIQEPAAKKPKDVLAGITRPKKDVLEGIVLKDKHKEEVPPEPKEPAYTPSQPAPPQTIPKFEKPSYAPAPSAPAQPEPKKEIVPMQLPPLAKYCRLLIDDRPVANVRLLPENSIFRVIYVEGTTELHPQLFMAKDASSYTFEGNKITQHEFVRRVAQIQKEGEKYIGRK